MTNARRAVWMVAPVLLGVLIPGLLGTGQKNDQAEMLLQQAQHKEMVDGQLEEAIQIYNKVLASYSGNRPVVAKALVEMGRCYEKLGRQEARSAYERVLREFADQAEPAGLARQRLTALETGRSGTEVAARLVWAAGTNWIQDVSSDGRYVAYVESESGNLALRELATGKTHRLTSDASSVTGQYVGFPLAKMSPDNRQVVYGWVAGPGSGIELRVVSFDGSAPRVLQKAAAGASEYEGAWMPDGKAILAVARNVADKTYQRLIITVADGSIQRIGTPDKRRLDWGLPSWDARYIAFERPQDDDTTKSDIFLFDTRTGQDTALVQNPAWDWIIGWTSDSKRFIFSSDRAGAENFWALEIENGKPKGPPQLINRDPEGDNLTVTRDGTLFQIQTSWTRELYRVEFDPQSGKPMAPPAPVNSRLPAMWMQWSPDGRSFCYQPMGKGTEGRPLMIRSLETGAERELPLKPSLRYYQWPRWSPDGRSILVAGRDQEVYGLFSIDVESGAVSRVVRILSDNAVSPSPSWSPDGKAVFYLQRDDAHPELTVIKRRDLASGAEKAVHRGLLGQTQLSPDGRQFAFIQRSSASQSSILAVMEVGGGESRELARIQPQDRVTDLVWTSDSRYVLFARSLKDQASEIWRAPTTGGQAERITALDGRVNGLKVHPNGRLLGIELLRYKNELWALENYLSPPGPVRQQR